MTATTRVHTNIRRVLRFLANFIMNSCGLNTYRSPTHHGLCSERLHAYQGALVEGNEPAGGPREVVHTFPNKTSLEIGGPEPLGYVLLETQKGLSSMTRRGPPLDGVKDRLTVFSQSAHLCNHRHRTASALIAERRLCGRHRADGFFFLVNGP